MIFAAGLGTRLKPLTDTTPKALIPINGHPLLELTIRKLILSGCTEIIVNVHHLSEQIIHYIKSKNWDVPIRISDETDRLLNTGGGLFNAEKHFTKDNSPILIHNVDILSNADLRDLYQNYSHNSCDAMLLVSKRETTRYLLFDNHMCLKGWTNIATGEIRSPFPDIDINKLNKFAFSGIHLFSPTLFKKRDEYNKEFSIIDFYLKECRNIKILGVTQPNLKMLDVGKIDSLKQAEDWTKDDFQTFI